MTNEFFRFELNWRIDRRIKDEQKMSLNVEGKKTPFFCLVLTFYFSLFIISNEEEKHTHADIFHEKRKCFLIATKYFQIRFLRQLPKDPTLNIRSNKRNPFVRMNPSIYESVYIGQIMLRTIYKVDTPIHRTTNAKHRESMKSTVTKRIEEHSA